MEIWVPYGDVESLVTLQAENIGEIVDPSPENHAEELAQQLLERMNGRDRLIVCDHKPATLKLLKAVSPRIFVDGSVITVCSPFATRIEERVPEVKGKITKIVPGSGEVLPGEREGAKVRLPPELTEGSKLVLSTGEPDPLYGYIDSKIALARTCVSGANKLAFTSRKEGEELPKFSQETGAYAAVSSMIDQSVQEAAYATIATRGGEPASMIDEGGAREAQTHLVSRKLSPAKGIVVGVGGYGYDETFSHALRLVLGAVKGLRRGGEMVIVSECRDGIGSEALSMYAMGRITESILRRGFYADGMEEIAYLELLKQQYSVTLISSLPELYAAGKFRFRAARSSAEALEKVFPSAGRNAKLHVITRASETLLT